ncbi:hypothetical protein Hanom_Chr10g00956521 [Helianthus anomalus]
MSASTQLSFHLFDDASTLFLCYGFAGVVSSMGPSFKLMSGTLLDNFSVEIV